MSSACLGPLVDTLPTTTEKDSDDVWAECDRSSSGSAVSDGGADMTEDELPAEVRLIIERIAPGWPEVLEVSPGWYPLLGRLNERLAAIAPGYVVLQCKSKFGSLSFHAQPAADPSIYVDEFSEVIRHAEWESIETCEVCGAPAKQYVIRLWVVTLYDQHAEVAWLAEARDGAQSDD